MKSVLIYSSTHHENTKKLVDAIARENEIEVINAEEKRACHLEQKKKKKVG